MTKIRLDDMTIEDVRKLYNPMFQDLISKDILDNVYKEYLYKYNEMIKAEEKGYKVKGGMGRKFNYLKNILYGWYIEDLFFLLIQKNPSVKNIECTGNDAEHKFIYDHINKEIDISGTKTTNPDFLITLYTGVKVYLELKTAAAEVYSVKIGNVKQLYKTMGYTNIYSMIIMVDLVNEKYEIKDLTYFINSNVFVNNRMEGQLCYDFPIPQKEFSLLKNENFEKYIDYSMFEIEEVKKYKALKIVEELGDKTKKRDIKNKISLDEIENNFKYQKQEFLEKVDKLIIKSSDTIFKSWDDILKDLDE